MQPVYQQVEVREARQCTFCPSYEEEQCSNCNQPICNIHATDFTETLGSVQSGNTVTTTYRVLRFCPICNDLTHTIAIAQRLRAGPWMFLLLVWIAILAFPVLVTTGTLQLGLNDALLHNSFVYIGVPVGGGLLALFITICVNRQNVKAWPLRAARLVAEYNAHTSPRVPIKFDRGGHTFIIYPHGAGQISQRNEVFDARAETDALLPTQPPPYVHRMSTPAMLHPTTLPTRSLHAYS